MAVSRWLKTSASSILGCRSHSWTASQVMEREQSSPAQEMRVLVTLVHVIHIFYATSSDEIRSISLSLPFIPAAILRSFSFAPMSSMVCSQP